MRIFDSMSVHEYINYENKIKHYLISAFHKYNQDHDIFAMQAAMYGALAMAPNWYTIEDDERGGYALCKLTYSDLNGWLEHWQNEAKDFIDNPDKWDTDDCKWTVEGSNTFLTYFVSEDVIWGWQLHK